MREIKFRVWSKDDEMTYSKDVGMSYFADYFMQKYSLEIIMQYTGLKDKNGVEIYEGDIVTHQVGYGNNQIRDKIRGEVYFNNGCYYVKSKLFDMDGPYDKKLSAVISDFQPEKFSCEIIGNIYEHKHLLEKAIQEKE